MKVRCIDAGAKQNLTVGKVYTVENEFGGLYTIKNDANGVGEYYKRRFEPVDETEEEITVTEMIDEEVFEDIRNDFSKCESKLMNNAKKKENVKMGMSLKERILNKLDYRSIAEQIYDRLEKEIIDDVVYYIDEDQIVEDMIYGYKSNYLEVAREVVAESIAEDIDANEIEDHFKEVVQEKVDDM